MIAEYSTSKWVQNLREHPEVQVKVGGKALNATARIVTPDSEPELCRVIQELSREKYGWGDGLVVELKPD